MTGTVITLLRGVMTWCLVVVVVNIYFRAKYIIIEIHNFNAKALWTMTVLEVTGVSAVLSAQVAWGALTAREERM